MTVKWKRGKIRRRRRPDDRLEAQHTSVNVTGLAGLQQQVGNQAMQRLLAQRDGSSLAYGGAIQRQEDESEPEKTGEQVKAPSGFSWVTKFPVSKELDDLDSDFNTDVTRFISVLS